MHELDVEKLLQWMAAIVLSSLGWLVRREIKRNDEYGQRIDSLEKTIPGLVKHSDLSHTETTIIEAIKDLKSEVRGERERINRLTEHRP
jgi:hypothetical protein